MGDKLHLKTSGVPRKNSIKQAKPPQSHTFTGVYQCIARGTTQLRQVTAYVNVRSKGGYVLDTVEPMYDVISVPMTVSTTCNYFHTA